MQHEGGVLLVSFLRCTALRFYVKWTKTSSEGEKVVFHLAILQGIRVLHVIFDSHFVSTTRELCNIVMMFYFLTQLTTK